MFRSKLRPQLTAWQCRLSIVERDSQLDLQAVLARSQSTRQPPRGGSGLEQFFQRNTQRSKSLGRDKGTQGLPPHLGQSSLGSGDGTDWISVFLSGHFYIKLFPPQFQRIMRNLYWKVSVVPATRASTEYEKYFKKLCWIFLHLLNVEAVNKALFISLGSALAFVYIPNSIISKSTVHVP